MAWDPAQNLTFCNVDIPLIVPPELVSTKISYQPPVICEQWYPFLQTIINEQVNINTYLIIRTFSEK